MAPRWKLRGNKLIASPAARAGILAASANLASTFVRGLLPRSVTDQALATGVVTAAIYQATTTAHAAAETFSLFTTGTHGMRGRKPDPQRTIVADVVLVGFGATVGRVLPPKDNESLATSITRFVGETLMLGGAAGAAVQLTDVALAKLFPGRAFAERRALVDVALGGLVAGFTVFVRNENARHFGLVDPDRKAIKSAGLMTTAKATATGVGAAAGLMVLTSAEQFVASSVVEAFDTKLRRYDIGSPLVGHAVSLGMLGMAGTGAFVLLKRRIERRGDIVEPAYPDPPTNPNVTAGPRSIVDFDTVGKEGRRYVLMALDAEAITAVMSEPATDPVRVVAGFEAAETTEERAELCLKEMDAVGAFDRALICIASPTGVGYVSYVFTETLEYLTRGDCATVVPQYALVPSVMALFDTHDGVALQRRVLEMTRDRIAAMPAQSRPRLVQFGESLGAQVALDVAYPQGAWVFDELGVERGLYLGVPFRSTTWNSWWNARDKFDPEHRMVLVSQPDEFAELPEIKRHAARQFMIVHHDDPVNKFTYRLVVKQPWWMGAPTARPPKVPRETRWRAVTTFVLTLVDLKNGMDFRVGEFIRKGHDYRIDTCQAVQMAYALPCLPEQTAAVEARLRSRESEWATRRLVARKFANARDSVARQLTSWGVNVPNLPDLDSLGIPEVADIDPTKSIIQTLGSSGVS
ncbi:MAG: alpha/beta-hydrolase family protein [Candidatus Nanopelagicales bacterium]